MKIRLLLVLSSFPFSFFHFFTLPLLILIQCKHWERWWKKYLLTSSICSFNLLPPTSNLFAFIRLQEFQRDEQQAEKKSESGGIDGEFLGKGLSQKQSGNRINNNNHKITRTRTRSWWWNEKRFNIDYIFFFFSSFHRLLIMNFSFRLALWREKASNFSVLLCFFFVLYGKIW